MTGSPARKPGVTREVNTHGHDGPGCHPAGSGYWDMATRHATSPAAHSATAQATP